ncbi:NAD-dependent epimerase/dehydratase family protein [Marilutibacter chinensis]|uniref:NAD-dependent epimerase/dehydratase family protein n=1 Tax=Marilutibacter chinensis TaxID=2912247 RepID=A0ABS9HYA0_9GAMM|nr:NAD-dependent epimerase/dehydratase family protein [Lysobacter chinensis]MCF7223783.1 NAD-dependent epimerase/dehydratase family protein [Lysobacter chinensis]
MKLLILGCGGFVGSHLLDRLLSRSDVEVEGWDPEVSKIAKHVGNPRFTFHQAPCIDGVELRRLEERLAWADALINLAAICNPAQYNTRPLDVIRTNLFDSYPIVEACARANKWLVYFSTSEVYGRTLSSYTQTEVDDPGLYELREDQTPLIMGPVSNQRWTYACAKQMMERIIYAHHATSGMPFTIIRPLNFFGPRMDYIPRSDGDGIPRVLACFMAALLRGDPIKLVDGGEARRTIVAIEEAVEAIVSMLDRPLKAQNRIFNIGNRNNEVTMRRLAEMMREIYAEITEDPAYSDHPIIDVSSETFYGPGYEDCDRRMPDLTHAHTLLDWHPRRNLREILLPTMRDYHARYANATHLDDTAR